MAGGHNYFFLTGIKFTYQRWVFSLNMINYTLLKCHYCYTGSCNINYTLYDNTFMVCMTNEVNTANWVGIFLVR